MPRWTSFAWMAATALVAAPVGTHYLSETKPAETHVVERAAATSAHIPATNAQTRTKAIGKSRESENLLTLEQDAVEQAKIDIAGVVCGFASQHVDATSHGCTPGVLADTEIMVAILPDPIHTQMALRFDRGVDGIENELTQLGWVYDRSWLPWENVRRQDAERWEDRRTDDHLQHAVETLPGVLLFRGKNEGQRHPLVVLLVVDTPTGGVNAEQFSQAIDFWQRPCGMVRQNCAEVHRTTLAILGPTFSGSAPSLHHLLHEKLAPLCISQKDLSVTISSGTISSGSALSVRPELPCSSISVRQESFAVDADYMSEHLRKYSSARIANLNEGETSFGTRHVGDLTQIQSFDDQLARLKQLKENRSHLTCDRDKTNCAAIEKDIDKLQGATAPGLGPVVSDTTVTNLTFPRGISRLRRAYEQNGIVGFTQSGNAPKTQLELSSADDDRNDDTVTNYSGSQNTLSLEAQMASLAKTLTTERFDAVLLSASDVTDEIFVARYLSQHAPDVTVVVSDADEFFLREGEAQSLQNIYTLSVWPLIERNSAWTNQYRNDPRVYLSKDDQGTAAALHHLVCTTIPLRDVRWPCSEESYREYRPPSFVNGATSSDSKDIRLKPPLWLSVIGHGGFMPVSLIDLDDSGNPKLAALSLPALPYEGDASASPRVIGEHTSLPIKLIAVLIIALLVLHGFACVRSRIDRPFAWIYARAERHHDMLRLLVRGTLSLFGVAALALLYVPDQQPVHMGTAFSLESFPFHLFLAGGEVLGVLISCISVWCAVQLRNWFRIIGPQPKQPETAKDYAIALVRSLRAYPLPTRIAAAYFAVMVLLLAGLHWNLWGLFSPSSSYPTEKIFFFYRTSLPLAGASPMLPLLLMTAAGVVWMHGIFSELAFFGHRIPKLPNGFEDMRCPSNKWVAGLNALLSQPFGRRRLYGLARCLLLTGFMICLPGRIDTDTPSRAYGFGIHSLSHGPFDLWMSLAVWLFSAVILQELATAFIAWGKLRHQCLIPLKQSPLRWGFTWIKGFSWKRIWTRTGNLSSNQIFDYLLRMAETNERTPGDSRLGRRYARATKHYTSDPKDDTWRYTLTIEVLKLHYRLKSAAEAKLTDLRVQWKTDAGPLTGTDEARGMHLLQNLDDVKNVSPRQLGARKKLLRRMGDEEFVALLYVGYITAVLVQIRHRLLRAAMMYILMMWALTCYPWMYRHTILIELSALLIVLSATAIYIYSQMHRDEILSRTTETESGKLDSGFFEKVIPLVGLPLLTLIASQFPEFSSVIFSWIQPGLSHMP